MSACGQSREPSQDRLMSKSIPPFSSDRLHQRLEDLRLAFEAKSLNVSDTLLSPLNESELRERCGWFPGEVVPELIALYAWRGGQEPGPWDLTDNDYPFWFRDCAFSSVAVAEVEYSRIMDAYGRFPEFHSLLMTSFPFAKFDSDWLVLPTTLHDFDNGLKRPIFSVGEGVDVYYYSIEKMVETCIDWVSHPAYTANEPLPEEVEHEIWRKHNPGIF